MRQIMKEIMQAQGDIITASYERQTDNGNVRAQSQLLTQRLRSNHFEDAPGGGTYDVHEPLPTPHARRHPDSESVEE